MKYFFSFDLLQLIGNRELLAICGLQTVITLYTAKLQRFMDPFLLKNPFTSIICGPTGSGKSTFVLRLLNNASALFSQNIKKIYYFYNNWQKKFEEDFTSDIEYRQGLPTEEDFKSYPNDEQCIVVIDDMQVSALNNIFIANLFSRDSHHRNISVILILQNLFHQGKYSRDISLNAHYFILFKNPRDIQQIKLLGRQLGMSKKLLEVYLDATQHPFGYLLIDLSPGNTETYMLRSHIFPDEHMIIYK